MTPDDSDDEAELRSVAIQNAQSILLARQRAEQEIFRAKEALEVKTKELAHSLAMMRATLEATWNGILVTDEHGTVTDFNQRYIDMWRLPGEVMESRQHSMILEHAAGQFEDSTKFLARIEEINATSPPESYDLLELSDGRVLERFSRIQFIEAQNVGRVWSTRDVTENRRAETALRAARAEAERANSIKDEFLATLSHELRTPLGAILGWSHMLRLPEVKEAERVHGLEVIERNARMQTQLIEDLLDMSRITSGKVRLEIQTVQPASFIEAATETVRPAAEAKGIRLDTLLDPAAGPIAGDPNRLQQVVWNLLSNAIKFTPKNGRVQAILQRVNSQIEIVVADTGIGIETDFLPYVFDRFRQADSSSTRTARGLGLGLSIVKHLVELHGGSVRVTSPGNGFGTTFTVYLPLTAVLQDADSGERVHPRTARAGASDLKLVNMSGIKVLLVDDQADARDLIQRVLTKCGAQILTASRADEGIVVLERERPDVLISDIGMPGVDGYEFLRRVRALTPAQGGKTPAIALTAFARSEDRTRALRSGFQVHLSKPVEPSELVAMVASVVGRTSGYDCVV